MQKTFEGTSAAPHSPFASSEAPSSPQEAPGLLSPRIAFTQDASEVYEATQTKEQKDLRRAAHAVWLAEQEPPLVQDPVAHDPPVTHKPPLCDAFRAEVRLREAATQRDFFGRPKPSTPLVLEAMAPLEELVATGAVTATPRTIAWAEPPVAASSGSSSSDTEELQEEAPEPLQHRTEAEDPRLGLCRGKR